MFYDLHMYDFDTLPRNVELMFNGNKEGEFGKASTPLSTVERRRDVLEIVVYR